jgi:nucleoside-diphosphate-sugar epimerase
VDATSASFRPPLASPHHAYCGAKAYCMKYLQTLRATAELPFSIAQIIPGTVIGPSELSVTASEALVRMDRMSRALLFNDPKPRYAFGFVHIDDCAAVHVMALDEERVHDSKLPDWFIAAATSPSDKNGEAIWKEAGNAIEMEFAEEIANGLMAVGRKNAPINMPFRVVSTLTEGLLLSGQKFRSLEECVIEVGQWYKKLVRENHD